ncbi:conserved Plasmodium protein, unknown function [Plasmodium gallinaceum]|uniref:Uncharacterized protein n=1 Tax=Plasmodium gallinaceum TaxID=5849 RepID=A0A1J1GYU6_PLAGA|nr:conserved Plasmodium protein, unknown function [Plasmodium gallinaceum]CRG97637.1 conserved Plasmodium protein, unknown function [Plasmodium gallinaceum]
MNYAAKKGKIHFNGFVKYSKKKKRPSNSIDYKRNIIKKENVNNIKEENVLCKMKKENIEINDQVEKRDESPITLYFNNKENYIRNDLPEGMLEKSSDTEYKDMDNYIIERIRNSSEFTNNNASLDDKNSDKSQTLSIKLKKEKKKNNLSCSKDPSRKKKCTLKKNDLDNKTLLINNSFSNPSYLPNYDNYGIQGPYYQTVYRRNKNKLKIEKYKKKYELPTIASLGKVKKLENLDLKINANLFNEKSKIILNNLSAYFGNKVNHDDIESSNNFKKKKKNYIK